MPKQKQQKKKKGPWIIIGVLSCLVLILLVIVGSYLGYRLIRRGIEEGAVNVEVDQPVNEGATLPAMASYTNSRYGFSFSYPVNWWWYESENGDGAYMSPDVNNLDEFNDSQTIISWTAYGWRNSGSQTMDEFLVENEVGNSQVFADYTVEKISDTTLGGLSAKRLDETYTGVDQNGVSETEAMKRIAIYHVDDNGGLGLIITCPEDKWEQKQVMIEKMIDSYKLNESVYEQEVLGSDEVIGDSEGFESEEMLTVAREVVEGNSSINDFSLEIDNQVGDWALVTATPSNPQEADPLALLMFKENGAWTVWDFGTGTKEIWMDYAPVELWETN